MPANNSKFVCITVRMAPEERSALMLEAARRGLETQAFCYEKLFGKKWTATKRPIKRRKNETV